MAELDQSCSDACGSGRCGRSEQSEIRDHTALLEIFPSECSYYNEPIISDMADSLSWPFFRNVESGCTPFPDSLYNNGQRSTCNGTAPDQTRRLCFCKDPQEHGFRCRCKDGFDGIVNWNTPVDCSPQDCSEAPFVPNGNNFDCVGEVAHGRQCTVTCDQGFEMVGSDRVTCQNGQYPTLPECVASNCTWCSRIYMTVLYIITREYYHTRVSISSLIDIKRVNHSLISRE